MHYSLKSDLGISVIWFFTPH